MIIYIYTVGPVFSYSILLRNIIVIILPYLIHTNSFFIYTHNYNLVGSRFSRLVWTYE